MRTLRESDTNRLRGSVRGFLPVLVGVVALVAGLLVLAAALGSVRTASPAVAVLGFVLQVPLYLGVVWGCVRLTARLERSAPASFGLTLDRRWLRTFLVGVAASLLGLALSLAWAHVRGIRTVQPGAVDVSGPGGPLVLAAVLVVFLGYSLVGNVFEEVLFRRVALQNFLDGLLSRGHSGATSATLAAVASLALFGLYHVPLRGSVLVAADAALVGVTFAVAYLVSGDLALPVGVHFGRFPTNVVYGVTVAGYDVSPMVALTRDTLAANLEFKLVQVGLVCLFVLAWRYATDGGVGLAAAARRATDG